MAFTKGEDQIMLIIWVNAFNYESHKCHQLNIKAYLQKYKWVGRKHMIQIVCVGGLFMLERSNKQKGSYTVEDLDNEAHWPLN